MRYIIATDWLHIFPDNVTRLCRWVYDLQEEKLSLLMVDTEKGWRQSTEVERADVLDSLRHGANENYLEYPENNDMLTCEHVPLWLIGEHKRLFRVRYRIAYEPNRLTGDGEELLLDADSKKDAVTRAVSWARENDYYTNVYDSVVEVFDRDVEEVI